MSDIAEEIFCMMNPNLCGAIFLGLIVVVGFYFVFQYIAQKINDKWPQFNIQLIMMFEAVVVVVLSVAAVGLMAYSQSKGANSQNRGANSNPRFNNNGQLVNRPRNSGTNFNAL
jgi:high-affinity Fe2+/Pb2+ permease